MKIKPLAEEDTYCLVFMLEKKKYVVIGRRKHKLKEGFYFYVGQHNERIHKAGNVVFLRRLEENHPSITKRVEKLSEDVIKIGSRKPEGHLHYFQENPLFERRFHEAIDVEA